MSSKHFRKSLTGVFAASALAIGLGFVAQSASAAVTTGLIGGSKHDLSPSGAGFNKTTNASAEICVFCHTPHGGNQAIAPLWNRAAATAATVYTSTSLNFPTPLAANAGSRSTMCLSCHDGATAMDTVVNGPGSGANLTATRITGYTWVTANGIIASGAPAGNMANLGDLSNDHPIGTPYCGGPPANVVAWVAGSNPVNATNCRDQDFNPFYSSGTSPLTSSFWVDVAGGVAGTNEKTDMKLYASAIAAFNGMPSVECASCHEPHSADATALSTSFLRTAVGTGNVGSKICLACHKK